MTIANKSCFFLLFHLNYYFFNNNSIIPLHLKPTTQLKAHSSSLGLSDTFCNLFFITDYI